MYFQQTKNYKSKFMTQNLVIHTYIRENEYN